MDNIELAALYTPYTTELTAVMQLPLCPVAEQTIRTLLVKAGSDASPTPGVATAVAVARPPISKPRLLLLSWLDPH